MTPKGILLVVSKIALSIAAINSVTNSMMGQAVSYSIHGYVLDTNSKPIVAANVILVSTPIVTVSDNEGFFSIDVIDTNYNKLQISSLGYKPRYLTVQYNYNDYPIAIYLKPLVNKIEQVKVMKSRSEYLKRKYSISIELVEEEFLKEGKAGSLMQTLSKIPGINSMNIGAGISKPMIRGMGYYRVVVAQNGIRQEGQQWSSHHGITINQNNVNHVEILKGPASLMYGSGAIGGVINVLPAHIPINQGVSGEASLTAKSNNNLLGGYGNIIARKGDVFINTSVSYSSYGDFSVPASDSFRLPTPTNTPEATHAKPLGNTVYNTAGKEGNASFAFGVIKNWGVSYLEFEYYGAQTGFFDWQGAQIDSTRWEHQSNSRDVKWPYQEVSHLSARHFTKAYLNKNKFELAIGFQQNSSDEYSYLEDRSGNRAEDRNYYLEKGGLELALELSTWHGSFSYTINTLERQKVVLGLNGQYQSHSISGYGHILPAYKNNSLGGYVFHKYKINENWESLIGFRVDVNSFRMSETVNPDSESNYGDSLFNPDFSKTNPGVSFMMGLNYFPNSTSHFKVNLGKSYRVPSAYELGAYGLHRHEGRFEKGDTACRSEVAWQFDLVYEKKWRSMQLIISPFMNYFTNFLYLNPTAILRPEGQVYEYLQSEVLMTGGELTYKWEVLPSISFGLGAEYVYSVNLDLLMPIPNTPPLSTISEFRIHQKGKNWLRDYQFGIEMVKVFSQNNTVPNELQTPGYISFNLMGETTIKIRENEVSLILRCRNLLNARYFDHISFYRRLNVPEPGRDIQLYVSLAL